ncbi:MAG: hypothetical protein Q9186_005228 [Xanthomendoza sp. 1 TL-2023]
MAFQRQQQKLMEEEYIMVLESWDRETLLARRRTGEISDVEFSDKVAELALAGITKSLQMHVPDLPSPDPHDIIGHLTNILKFQDAISSKDSEYQKVLMRAENTQELVRSIFDDWERLRRITTTYADLLEKRWTKRVSTSKRNVLLNAWPGMNPMHRPDFEVIRRELRGSAHRDALMMPYINLEDLSSEKNLLYLMGSRAQVYPEHFAWTDSLPIRTATAMDAIQSAGRYEKVMFLTGQTTRETYGKLKALKIAEVENILWTGFACHLGHGLVILETQQRLYRFLVRCAELLLHDIDMSKATITHPTAGSIDNTSLAYPSVLPGSVEWQSVSKMNTTASYHLPRPFSLDFLCRLAGAQRDAAEEDFWSLHEDPGYFQQQVNLKFQRNLAPCQRAESSSRMVELAASRLACIHVVHETCQDVILWQAMEAELLKVQAVAVGLDAEFELTKRLPPIYEKAMESLVSLTLLTWDIAVSGMYRVLLSSPAFVDLFPMASVENGRFKDFKLPHESTRDSWPPILHLLVDLGSENKRTMGALNILDEMERLMISDMVQRTMISTQMAKEISKLAALAQIHDSLRRHQPSIQVTQESGPLLQEQSARLRVIKDLERYLMGESLGPFTKPSSGFVYPVGNKRTSHQVDQMPRAEAKLDGFWQQVDKKIMNHTRKTLLQWMGDRIRVRDLHRTQPWQPEAPKPVRPAPETLFQPFPISAPSSTERLPTEPKTKAKRRGEPSTAFPVASSAAIDSSIDSQAGCPTGAWDNTEPSHPSFTLSSKVYKIMSAFFPTSAQDRTSRKIVWKDFLHAMFTLDFHIQNRHGSEWYFEPSWKRNAPITIHEPHPSHEMRFDKIRFVGNRMARKYGWTSETFAQAG